MKTLVPAKRVVDYNVELRVKIDGSGVDITTLAAERLRAPVD